MSEEYLKMGVSATKEDVKKAISNQDKGIFEGAFCKLTNDISRNNNFVSAMHADGAGTKSVLTYIYYKETGDTSIFEGIAQDSLVMNIDDLLCVGATNNFLVSNTIGRNAHRVNADCIKHIIEGYSNFSNKLKEYGINVIMSGGETADVGDLVSTVIADSTIYVRIPKNKVIDCSNIKSGNVIVGLASYGKATYETKENSGISSNGLTAARHSLLSKYYAEKYPETYSSTLTKEVTYCGKYKYEDNLPGSSMSVGEAILSPTRTYAPVVKEILGKYSTNIYGLINCTGGGQTKCTHFGKNLHFIKDNLFDIPPIFNAIKNNGNIDSKEMYKVFNMGHRMEIYCDKEVAENIIKISNKFNIDAKIVGRVESSEKQENELTIIDNGEIFKY